MCCCFHEFKELLKGKKNGKLVHLRFEDLRGEHPALFKEVNAIPINFKICDEQALSLRRAAEILVGKAVEELRGDAYWRSLLN